MIRIVITPKTTRAELGALICGLLEEEEGNDPVLVGGAAMTIYSGQVSTR